MLFKFLFAKKIELHVRTIYEIFVLIVCVVMLKLASTQLSQLIPSASPEAINLISVSYSLLRLVFVSFRIFVLSYFHILLLWWNVKCLGNIF